MTTEEDGGIRVAARRGYTVIPNGILPEGRVSARAWGVYVYLMSRPPGWECRVAHLRTVFTEGRDAMYSALRALVDAELMAKETYRDAQGIPRQRFVLMDPDAPRTEKPEPGRPDTDSPDTAFPNPEKPDLSQYGSSVTTEVTHPAADGDGVLFGVAVPKRLTGADLVAAWCDAWTAARGRKPDAAVVKRVAGACGQIAKTRTDEDSWDHAIGAATKAGREGRQDVVQVLADFRPPARGRNNIDWDAAMERASSRDAEREGFSW